MAQFLFWISLSLIAGSYFGYPIALCILVRLKNEAQPVKKDIEPSVTLVIPAYNEEKVIGDKVENALSLDYPKEKIEILLVLDGCTDKTEEIAEKFSGGNLKILERKPRRGKMAALNFAVPQAKGEIIIFTDANSKYEKDAIRKLMRNFADGKIGCVCGELKYQNESMLGEGEDLYWKYEKFIKIKESRLRSLLVVNGSIYAIRKELFEPVNETLADDFVIPMKVAKKGYGLVYEPEAVTLEKTAANIIEGMNQKARIISQGFKASFSIGSTIFSSGPLRIFQFLFHKFIRWLVPLFLVIILISSLSLIDRPFYKVVFLGNVMFYMFALIGYLLEERRLRIKIFKIPFYFCIVNIASAIGAMKFLSGGIKGTWEKAETTRG